MRILSQKLKDCFRNGVYLGVSALFVFTGAGCASTHKTTKTTTVITESSSVKDNTAGQDTTTSVSASAGQQNRRVIESKITTTTTQRKGAHPGILSSTVHAIGWVIALPFRLIGGLIGWIF